MIRACFFDLDGTLQDSEILWVEATRRYLEDRGARVSPAAAQEMVYGRGWGEVFADMTRHLPSLAAQGFHATAGELRAYYQRLRAATSIALPGSVALLRRLAASLPVAIVSGSTRHDIQEAIDQLEIGDCLSFFVGAEDYRSGKPAPDCFQLAAARLGVAPATCGPMRRRSWTTWRARCTAPRPRSRRWWRTKAGRSLTTAYGSR